MITLDEDPPEYAALAGIVVAVGPVHRGAIVDHQHVAAPPHVVATQSPPLALPTSSLSPPTSRTSLTTPECEAISFANWMEVGLDSIQGKSGMRAMRRSPCEQ